MNYGKQAMINDFHTKNVPGLHLGGLAVCAQRNGLFLFIYLTLGFVFLGKTIRVRLFTP
jgi:hypothetical protein